MEAVSITGKSYDLAGKRAWVAGHGGMVGGALVRRLGSENCEIVLADRQTLDLRNQSDVIEWLTSARPHVVFVAAARVGGILANERSPADFLYDNLMIEANIIAAAFRAGVEKLLFLGSSCIYPKFAEQPIREEALLTGSLEPTNEWYALAKIAGIKLCQAYRLQHAADFISAMPTNLYGPGDNYDLLGSHVIPALLRKFHEAKTEARPQVEIWGTGRSLREFLHVDDLADACVFMVRNYSDLLHLNIGSGEEVTIAALAGLVAEAVGYTGRFLFDTSRPDGTPRKLLDTGRLNALGWRARTRLSSGLRSTYRAYLEELGNGSARSVYQAHY